MVNKNNIAAFVMVLLSFSMIFSIPIVFLSDRLSTYGIINESLLFEYVPDTPSSIEKLYLNVDVGNIEIRYIEPPVDYYAMIEVNIIMSGANSAGKSHKDYFNISWNKTHSPANFTLELISDDWFNQLLWSMQNVSIIVTLRKNIVFSIKATVREGDLEITVPWGVSINNLVFNITEGDILYDLDHCVIEGNITGIVNRGNINLNTINAQYTRNSIWTLITELGDIKIDIVQYKDLGANVTGKATISTKGDLHFYYMDNKPSVGARFILRKVGMSPIMDFIGGNTIGFGRSYLPEGRGTVYTSKDFPATNCYVLSLKSSGRYYGGASSD